MNPKTPKASVYAEMLLLSFVFGIAPVASKFAAEGFPVFTVAALRIILGSLIFIPIVTLTTRRWPRLTLRDLAWFVFLGAAGFLLFGTLYFLGLQYTTATHAIIVFGASPIITALLSALILKEVITGEKIAGILLTVVGVGLIVAVAGFSLASSTVIGDLILLGAVVSWACYTISSKRLMPRFGSLIVTAYSVMAGAVLLTPVALMTDFRFSALTSAPLSAWLGLCFSGVFSVVLAYILWNRGVSVLGPTLTAVFMNVGPVWGFLTAYLLRGEAITGWQILSAVLVIGGVTLANWSGLRLALKRRQAVAASR